MAGCSVETLISGMVNNYARSPKLLGWANQTSPIIDVTDTVKQVRPDVLGARLTIYGDPNRVRVIYKSATKPPDQTVQQIVQNWLNGIELERQYCQADGLWYLVQYPCKLEIIGPPGLSNPLVRILGVMLIIGIALDLASRKSSYYPRG